MMQLSPKYIPTTPTVQQLAPPPAYTPPAVPETAVSQFPAIPDWMIYFIGALLAIVMLSLIIILAVVLKIRRF